ncbi:hypothetical protein LINPERPRIM_LOCUS20403 [Linum perenne]
MANESGAQIRILPRDKLPLCASARDDVVQVMPIISLLQNILRCFKYGMLFF